jgi:hypothetical protein
MVIVTLAVGEAIALHSMPAGIGYPSRWIAVMVSMSIVAVAVRALTNNNDRPLLRLEGEAEQLRSSDIVARVGGEEFVMLLPGSDSTVPDVVDENGSMLVGSGAPGRSAASGPTSQAASRESFARLTPTRFTEGSWRAGSSWPAWLSCQRMSRDGWG